MFKNTATVRALTEMQASLTILWQRKRLGLCCVELHYGLFGGQDFLTNRFLRNFEIINKMSSISVPNISNHAVLSCSGPSTQYPQSLYSLKVMLQSTPFIADTVGTLS